MVQALLMALLALVNANLAPLCLYAFREPVMAGFWVGLIFGDPVQGTIIGATINISYLGWISAGGSNSSDLYWAGLLGTFVAIKGGMSVDAAVAFAVPIGLLGNYAHIAWMSINSIWPTKMDSLAEKGDWKGQRLLQMVGGPLVTLLVRSVPVFVITLYGGEVIQEIINIIPASVMAGLTVTGKVLPALGMSMLFKFMYKKEILVFFIIGFAIAAYTGVTDLLLFAIIGVCMALVLTNLGYNQKGGSSLWQN